MESPRSPFIKSYSVPGRMSTEENLGLKVRRRAKSPGRRLTQSAARTETSIGGYLPVHHIQAATKHHLNISTDVDEARPNKRRRVDAHRNTEVPPSGIISRFVCIVFRFIKLIILLIFAVGLLLGICSFILIWMNNRCFELQTSQFDLGALKDNLTSNVYGQGLAIEKLLNAIEGFGNKDISETSSADIIWCVGWSGGGKSKSMDIIKKSLSGTANIQYILPSLVPNSKEAIDILTSDIMNQMKPCKKEIIIIDGWDDKQESVLKLAASVSARVASYSKVNGYFKQVLLIISGTKGSKVLNKQYLSERLRDRIRDDMTSTTFIDVVKRTDEYQNIISLGSNVAIVPFLPLENNHVELCIKKEMKRLHRMLEKGILVVENKNVFQELDEEKLISSIMNTLPFVPPEYPILSSTGCKRVMASLKLKMGDVEIMADAY